MLDFIKYLLQYFTRRWQNLTVHQQQPDDALHNRFNSDPRCIPIETNIDEQPIAGTVTQSVCKEESLLQGPTGKPITLSHKRGIRCGCHHIIYSVEPSPTQPGLGGQCPLCMLKAVKLQNQGLIGLEEAEAMSLYCSRCSSRCDGCGISACRHHIHQFINLDNSVIYLCDECLKQAERDKLFKQALTIMFSPFLDYKNLPPPREKRSPDEY